MTQSGKHILNDREYSSSPGHAHLLLHSGIPVDKMVRGLCISMTDAGCTNRQQVETLWGLGISIGGGGTGPDGSIPECPYCGCYGGGGHGGFCPNQGISPQDWTGQPGS